MTRYHMCKVKHDPVNGTYGDCLRAVFASMLDKDDIEEVPHFLADNPDDAEYERRIHDYLKSQGLALVRIGMDGNQSAQDIALTLAIANPSVHFILAGSQGEAGNHVVVYCNGELVCDPAWFPMSLEPMQDANGNTYWEVMLFVPLVTTAP